MQHDHKYPSGDPRPRPENTPDRGPMHFVGLAIGFGVLAIAIALVASLGVAAIVAVWGWIL